MLTLTENANAIVGTLVTRQTEAVDAGLRIQATDATGPNGEARFAVNVVTSPEPADQIVDGGEGRIFLEETAAAALSDKVLDAGVDDSGAVSFTILPQPM